MTAVAGVVVTHGPVPELEACLHAVKAQVDELVVVANLPGPLPVPEGTRLIENERPLGFAANANQGVRATTSRYVALVNPDAVPEPDVVPALVAFAEATPRCGIAGPRLLYPDGTWQPSRRRFPTVWGTAVRRTPLRLVLDPKRFSRSHYLLDEPVEEPVEADWLLGAFLLLRRAMFDELDGFDEGFRLYGEDIDLAYRAAAAGWQRWYVPTVTATHRWDDVTGRRFFTVRTLWHWRGMLRFVRKHPERLRALR